MAGKSSPCGNTGNNSRTCCSSRYVGGGGGRGPRLFGVQLNISSPMKKSVSMDCLSPSSYPAASCSPSPSSSSSSSSLISIDETTDKMSSGYRSDGLMGRAQERKKGVPWSEEEHRAFLAGLEKLGKGDWRGISRNFVTTRTPTQVASHAQKYFLRQNSFNKKKRRSSLLDVVGSGGRVAHSTDLFKFKEPSLSCELGVPILSLNPKDHAFNDKATSDLNSSSKEEPQLPSYLHLMPNSPTLVSSSLITPALHSSSTMAQPQLHLALPDLELTISSSRLLGQRSTRGPVFDGRVDVT